MIRPYLRDLINDHQPTVELNNNNNNNNRAQWKIQLTMQNSCISTKSFEETRTIHSKSEPVETFMGTDTEDFIDKLFNTLLKRFQRTQKAANDKGSKFIPDSVELLYSFSKNRH